MRASWGLYGLVLWTAATLTAFLLHFQGVYREPVRLTLADGTTIHGVLYRGTDAENTTPLPSAIVLHGMAVSHKSCEVALAMPLARCGFVVLAIDMRGHGRSDGSLPLSWFCDLDRLLELKTDQPEVEAALQYLNSLPAVDGQRISLLGHSLGGLAAVNAACAGADVASVVAISVAPQMCDAELPRNLYLLAGDLDRLIPPERYIPAIRRATGGHISQPEIPYGKRKDGTGRQLCVAHWVSHMSPLFDPSASRRAVQWSAFSMDFDPGSVPGDRLIGINSSVLLAVLAGGIAFTVVLRNLAQRFLTSGSVAVGAWSGVALALAFCFLAAPTAALLSDYLPTVGVLYAASSLVLVALLALVWIAVGLVVGRNDSTVLLDRPTWADHGRGAALGMLCFALGMVWLGLPLGTTWMDLTPCFRRVVVGLLLLPLFLPWSLLLSRGIQRAVPSCGRRFGLVRAFAWLAIPAAVWIGNELFNGGHPFFGISVSLLAFAFLLPLPLWLVEDRKGMTTARAVSLAASASWLYACHLPFVNGG